MKTKAELEAEINDLKVRVAELEGANAAYQFALSQVKPTDAGYPYQPFSWPTWTFNEHPNVLPCVTSTYNFSE